MEPPTARGDLSQHVLELLQGSPAASRPPRSRRFREALRHVGDPLTDGDLQLALALTYELLYHRIDGVDPDWEWHPALLTRRALLERSFEAALRRQVPQPQASGPIWQDLRRVIAADGSPSTSRHLARNGTLEQMRDHLMQRSVYHLREADSHTWAIPRLDGAAKAALVEIQADEYGGGQAARMHASLFAQTLRAAGLDDRYGVFWDRASAQTLASANLATMFALHTRLLGAACGHLAAFEMTSTGPNRDYGRAVRRLGLPEAAAAFFDEHVEADAVHEQLAAVDLCGALVAHRPELAEQVLWGAACALSLDAASARHLLDRWGVTDQHAELNSVAS